MKWNQTRGGDKCKTPKIKEIKPLQTTSLSYANHTCCVLLPAIQLAIEKKLQN
jgi:hypothetical protein